MYFLNFIHKFFDHSVLKTNNMQQFLTGGVQFAIEERKYYFGKGN